MHNYGYKEENPSAPKEERNHGNSEINTWQTDGPFHVQEIWPTGPTKNGPRKNPEVSNSEESQLPWSGVCWDSVPWTSFDGPLAPAAWVFGVMVVGWLGSVFFRTVGCTNQKTGRRKQKHTQRGHQSFSAVWFRLEDLWKRISERRPRWDTPKSPERDFGDSFWQQT